MADKLNVEYEHLCHRFGVFNGILTQPFGLLMTLYDSHLATSHRFLSDLEFMSNFLGMFRTSTLTKRSQLHTFLGCAGIHDRFTLHNSSDICNMSRRYDLESIHNFTSHSFKLNVHLESHASNLITSSFTTRSKLFLSDADLISYLTAIVICPSKRTGRV